MYLAHSSPLDSSADMRPGVQDQEWLETPCGSIRGDYAESEAATLDADTTDSDSSCDNVSRGSA